MLRVIVWEASAFMAEVEQLDQRALLADVDADDVAEGRVDREQRAGPTAVGVLDPDLDDHALLDQVPDQVAHGGGAEAGCIADLLAGHRAVHVHLDQCAGSVVLAQVSDVGGPGPRHSRHLSPDVDPRGRWSARLALPAPAGYFAA